MKILVTGCNGFIGKNIIKYGCSKYEVYGIGRSMRSNISAFEYICVDICNREELFTQVMNKMRNVDVIIHAAAEISDNTEKLYLTNCYGTQNMIELAQKLDCKQFIYISSIPIIGKPIEFPITEQHRIYPKTVYHYTKYFGEQIVRQLNNFGIINCILRIASPVGAEMPNNKIFSVFVEKSIRNEDIIIWGDGTRIQNYIDIRDFVQVVEKVIKMNVGGLYNIPGNSISDYDLAKKCIHCFDSKSNVCIKNDILKTEVEKWIISGKAAERDLGYIVGKTIEDSIYYVAEGLKK